MSQEETWKSLVIDAFGVGEDDFSDEKTPEDLPDWTSVTHMSLMSKFEETFSIQLDVEDITAMDSLGNMKAILRKYGVDI
jgi:acyl carrier protein